MSIRPSVRRLVRWSVTLLKTPSYRDAEDASSCPTGLVYWIEGLKAKIGGPRTKIGGPKTKIGGPEIKIGGPEIKIGGPRDQDCTCRAQNQRGGAKTKIGGL